VLLILDLAWATFSTARHLSAARTDLDAGVAALERGDVEPAQASFEGAAAAASAAGHFDRHPSVTLLRLLPAAGDHVEAIDVLADAAGLTAASGEALVLAAGSTGWTGSGLPGVAAAGDVDLSLVAAATPHLDRATQLLSDAQMQVDGIDVPALAGFLRSRVESARSTLDDRARVVRTADDVVHVLPNMLGGRGPRRYLLALQNLSAPRGTGGFLGFVGVLEANAGRIHLSGLKATADVRKLRPVRAPAEVVRRYGRYGVQGYLHAANYSPDFPTTSRILMEMARQIGLGKVDGVVAVDTIWMSDILQAIGPVTSAAWRTPIAASNVVDVLNRDTFTISGARRSNAVQRQIGLDVWHALLSREPEPQVFASAMSASVEERHFQVFATDPRDESVLDRLGASGRATLGTNPLYVVWQDFVSSRAGFFASKSVSDVVTLSGDGSAEVRTTVTLHNGAPDGPPSTLLGTPQYGQPVGYYAAIANVYLPVGASDVRTTATGPSVTSVEHEFGHPVATGLLRANPGGSMSFTASYTAPNAVTDAAGLREFRIDYLPQPSLRPVPFTIQIQLPPGAQVQVSSPGVTVSGDSARYTGTPETAQGFWVRYTS
jgi:hypothetical protein